MRYFFILALMMSFLYADEIKKPIAKYLSSGGVVDFVYADSKLYSATNAGCLDIFDLNTREIIKQIKVDKITDFMGDFIDSKLYSVDVLDDLILILSQAQKGARRIHLYKDEKLELIIPYTERLFIAKAKFIDKNTIIMALLSNEIILYNIKEKTQNYRIQVSQSKFSDFVLNEKKDEIIVADESGELSILSVKNGSLKKKLKAQNLDNVFQVDSKNSTIATAGQDRRVVIYKRDSAYYETSDFLIYSVGLSPSGNIVAYSSDENNNVTAFDTNTKKILGKFGGNKMTLTNILFLNENEFLVSSDDNTINLYKIK